MAIQLNHTIVSARDKETAATFLTEILGLPGPTRFGPFAMVEVDNGVTLDFIDAEGDITSQHYAFLIGETEFDEIFERVTERALPYWADPGQTRTSQINRHNGGRRIYFEDPSGHLMEVLTRP